MEMYLLVLEFVAFCLHGVQLMSLIVLSIGAPNQCFVNKVDKLDESVPMEIDTDTMEVDQDLQDLMDIDNDLMEVD